MKNKAFLAFFCFIGIVSTPAFSDITLTLNSGEFVQHDNGTVTDNTTGLTWQVCAVGQIWNGSTGSCMNKAHVFTYANALKITSDFADETDWRLPSLIELNSIFELKNNNQPVNKLIFPQMPMDRGFISSTIYAAKTQSLTWIVLTNSGKNSQPASSSPSTGNYVRLVRGRMKAAIQDSTVVNTSQSIAKTDLKVTLAVSSNPVKLNQYIHFTINVSNKGKLIATDTIIHFYLPTNLMQYDLASDNCEKNGESVICNVGDIQAGESVSKTIRVAMQKVGAMSTSVSVKANEVDLNNSDNQAKLTISIKK